MMQEADINDQIVLIKSVSLPLPIPIPIPRKKPISKTPTILGQINDKLNDQDFIQKVSMIPIIALEMYRVMVSSFLVLFVPQKCDNHVCSLSENMVLENDLYTAGLVFNFITMASFIAMYLLEIKRENRLITYLEVNKSVAFDNSSVEQALAKLPISKRDSIWALDKYYMYSGLTSIGLFIINTILSGFVVYNYYLDSQTTSTYITNILFMVTKLADVYSNVNTEKNVFYSAYMKGKIQYNDVDPDKVTLLLQDIIVEKNNEIPDKAIPDKAIPDKVIPNNEIPDKVIPNEEEEHKIVVTLHDISSNPSSSNDLQNLDNPV